MVKDFKKRGVPIDGVGIQAHILNFDMKEISSLAANLARLTALGVQVHITEMDVALPLDATGALLDQADLARQADIYRFVATACLQQPGCTAFQTWGFTDKYSWIPGYTKGRREGHCFSIKLCAQTCLQRFARSPGTGATWKNKLWSMKLLIPFLIHPGFSPVTKRLNGVEEPFQRFALGVLKLA